MKKNRLLSCVLAICMFILCFPPFVFADDEMRGITVDFDSATDAELQQAILDIKEEMQNRKTKELEARQATDFEGIKVGDFISFGHYETDNVDEDGYEPVTWIVLAREGNNALLISHLILDIMPFHSDKSGTDYAHSDIRAWLNDDFVTTAFSAEEQEALNDTSLSDKVFLLSREEARTYFGDNRSKSKLFEYYETPMTKYVYEKQGTAKEAQSAHPFRGTQLRWYMSTTTIDEKTQKCFVHLNRTSYSYFETSTVLTDYSLGGVRPAIWVNLEAAASYIETDLPPFEPELWQKF